MKGRILLVDDDQAMCDMLARHLGRRGYEVATHQDGARALAALATSSNWDTVLTDVRMPALDGIELCQRIVAEHPEVPVVVVTAFGSMETAIEALRAGAYDFVTKPFELDRIAMTVDRAVQHRGLQEQVKMLHHAVQRARADGEMIGGCPAMTKLQDQIDRVASSRASVLITGESGSGKELVARALHDRSRRRAGPFVAVNCTALPEPLLESELFGHARGAFTGALESRKGLFLQAKGGTLFLDEIGDLSIGLQPKLLRALEERKVRPVGSDVEVEVDVRLVAATNRDLERAVEERRFREDLFFRVHVVRLEVPPLRARGSDVLTLAQHFLEHYARQANKNVVGLAEPVAKKLLLYDWPGNVRELRNAIERAVAWAEHDKITADDLPERIHDHQATRLVIDSGSPAELASLEEMERRYILHVLRAVGGHRALAARVLGVHRKTLYRKLCSYGAQDEHD